MPPVRVRADVAKIAFILMDEKTPFADFYGAKVVDVHGEIVNVFLAFVYEIEREPDRLARADGGELGKLVNDVFDGIGEFHRDSAINTYHILSFWKMRVSERLSRIQILLGGN